MKRFRRWLLIITTSFSLILLAASALVWVISYHPSPA